MVRGGVMREGEECEELGVGGGVGVRGKKEGGGGEKGFKIKILGALGNGILK